MILDSVVNSEDLHFQILAEQAIERLQIKIPEPALLKAAKDHPSLQYRVLFYSLLYNSRVLSSPYEFSFFFEVDVREALKKAKDKLLEWLVQLVSQHMPWFFISSLVESSSCPNLPESFLLKFSHCFPSVSESEVQDFVCLLAWHPLKVSLEFLNALRPVAASPHETLNPLRVFQVLKLDSSSTVE